MSVDIGADAKPPEVRHYYLLVPDSHEAVGFEVRLVEGRDAARATLMAIRKEHKEHAGSFAMRRDQLEFMLYGNAMIRPDEMPKVPVQETN